MESDASARSLLSLFASSKLTTLAPQQSRDFYETKSPTNATTVSEYPRAEKEPQRKRSRRQNAEWTTAEMCALETYRSLMKGSDIDCGLRDLLLPNRTDEEVTSRISKLKEANRENAGRKLFDLEREETEQLLKLGKQSEIEREEDIKRRRKGMDDILGLGKVVLELIERQTETSSESEVVEATVDTTFSVVEEISERNRHLDDDTARLPDIC